MKNLKSILATAILMIGFVSLSAQNLKLSTFSGTSTINVISEGDTLDLSYAPVDSFYVDNFFAWANAQGVWGGSVSYKIKQDGVDPGIWNYDMANDKFPAFAMDTFTVVHKYEIRCNVSGAGHLITFYVRATPVSASTGINDHAAKVRPEVSAFPNPMTDNLTVTFKTNKADEKIEIFDIQGRMVVLNTDERETGKNTVKIDVSQFSSGIYFVRVASETFKIVKQ